MNNLLITIFLGLGLIYLLVAIITLVHVGNSNGKEIAEVKIQNPGNPQNAFLRVDFNKAFFSAIAWPAYYSALKSEVLHTEARRLK